MPIPQRIFPFDTTILRHDLNNALIGTGGVDYIQGLGGDDRLFARDGEDYLDGGAGNAFIVTRPDARVADARTCDDSIDLRMESNGGHVMTGGAVTDSVNVFAPSSRAWSGKMVDFNVEDATFLIDRQDGSEHLGLTRHSLVLTEIGITVTLVDGDQISFPGSAAEDFCVLIKNLIIGRGLGKGGARPRPCKTCHRPARWCAALLGPESNNE